MSTPAAPYAQGMNLVVDSNPLAAKTISNGKYDALKFADLGSAIVANYSMSNAVDNVKPTENKYGAYSLTDPNYQLYGYTQNQSGGRYFTFQILSALFGGSAENLAELARALHLNLSVKKVL